MTIHQLRSRRGHDYRQAIAAGARATMPVQDMFWGDRYGVVPIRSATRGRSRRTRRTSPRTRWQLSVAASSWRRCRTRIGSDAGERRGLEGLRRLLLVAVLALCTLPEASAAATLEMLTVTLNLWHDQRDWPKRLERDRRRDAADSPGRAVPPGGAAEPEPAQPGRDARRQPRLPRAVRVGRRPRAPQALRQRGPHPHRVLVAGARNLEPADDYRAVAHVRFDWRGRAVDAYSTHLHHTPQGGAIRATQIRHLLAYVDSTRGDGPAVIAGGLQAELGTPEMDLVDGAVRRCVPRRAPEGEPRGGR